MALGGAIAVDASIVPSSLGDVNGDGAADFSYGQRVVFGGAHLRTIASEEQLALYGYELEGFALGRMGFAGDVNGDSLADLIYMTPGQVALVYGKDGAATVSWSDVDNGIGGVPVYGANRFPYTISAGDLNEDGFGELVLGDNDTMMVIAGQQSWTELDLSTVSSLFTLPSTTTDIAAGDFDGDKRLELAYCGENGVSVVSAPNGWNNEPKVTTPTSIQCRGFSNVLAGDFDLSGTDDLIVDDYRGVVPGPAHGVSLLYGPVVLDGDKTLNADEYSAQLSGHVVADLDGNGLADIVVSTLQVAPSYAAHIAPLADWPSEPCSGDWSPLFDALAAPFQAASLGDIDADGKDDLFVFRPSEDSNVILLDACD